MALNKFADWGALPQQSSATPLHANAISLAVERLISEDSPLHQIVAEDGPLAAIGLSLEQLRGQFANGSPLVQQISAIARGVSTPAELGPPRGAAVQLLRSLTGVRNALLDHDARPSRDIEDPESTNAQLEAASRTHHVQQAQDFLAKQHPDLWRDYCAQFKPLPDENFQAELILRLQAHLNLERRIVSEVDEPQEAQVPAPTKTQRNR
ncbi:MAG: hypothetical protein EKK52_15550 [Burkholderiales bacterium]|uniref:hypothetical protein n=1 Tax=Roseateles sp. TaxID=1971397 RepID=UPI000F9D1A23|nr:MAG: hypothetical protein EKK52_15550 [Burkholderiales bacterium]